MRPETAQYLEKYLLSKSLSLETHNEVINALKEYDAVEIIINLIGLIHAFDEDMIRIKNLANRLSLDKL